MQSYFLQHNVHFSLVQSTSRVRLFATPYTAEWNEAFQNNIDTIVPKKFICGTNTGPAATSQASPWSH